MLLYRFRHMVKIGRQHPHLIAGTDFGTLMIVPGGNMGSLQHSQWPQGTPHKDYNEQQTYHDTGSTYQNKLPECFCKIFIYRCNILYNINLTALVRGA